MKLELDPDYLRVSMQMWRDTVDMKIPIRDDFKIHLMQNRATSLANFKATATAWRSVLRHCKAIEENQPDLESLQAEVQAFLQWAEDGLTALGTLSLQEQFEDLLPVMPKKNRNS